MMKAIGLISGAALCLFGVPCAAEPHLPDTFLARVEALASMETLNASILASHSATRTLEAWCSDHHLATPAKIKAAAVGDTAKPIGAEQRAHLQIGPEEPVNYRHVRLTCGTHVLSDAENWYVPSRLTPEMNKMLETTDTPFGKAVAALGFVRVTFAADQLWQPLPPGWEIRPPPPDHADADLVIPDIIFEHRALLYDARHQPFSEVDEHYTRDNLAFDLTSRR